MALYYLRVTLSRPTDDEVVYTYAVDGSEPTELQLTGLMSVMQTQATATGLNTLVQTTRLEEAAAYEAAGGPAVAVASVATEPFTNGGPGISDVSLVVSEEVQTVRGIKPRGRLYYGPINGQQMTSPRPSALTQTIVRDFHDAILDSLVADGFVPVVISKRQGGLARPAPVGLPILALSTDNTWDTQRSRDLDPTARVVQAFPTVP